MCEHPELTLTAVEQALEELIQDAVTIQETDGGLLRSLGKLMLNQRLTGNDYARLTITVQLALAMVAKRDLELKQMEGGE